MNIQPGEVFGRLTVVEFCPGGSKYRLYLCNCSCGNTTVTRQTRLRAGTTKSCGCLQREIIKQGTTKLPLGVEPRNNVYFSYITGAKRRGYVFELTKDEFFSLVVRPCCYCGAPPRNVKKAQFGPGSFVYSGLDRLDSLRGYIIDNVVPCCITCNRAKRSLSKRDFLLWIRRVYEYSDLKNLVVDDSLCTPQNV